MTRIKFLNSNDFCTGVTVSSTANLVYVTVSSTPNLVSTILQDVLWRELCGNCDVMMEVVCVLDTLLLKQLVTRDDHIVGDLNTVYSVPGKSTISIQAYLYEILKI